MKMKKMLAGLLALALCLGAMAGCSSDAGNESAPAESPSEAITDAVESGEIDGAKVGVLVVSTQSQWCNDLIAGVTEVCEANGMQVIVSDSQVSVDQEIAGMENLINAGCDAIVVNCMNAAGLADLCQQAQDQGHRVQGNGTVMVAEAIESFIAEKGLEAPEMATIWLADANNPDTNAGQYKAAQEAAFEERLVNGLGVNIVNSQYASDTNASMNVAEAILAANPDVKIIFTQSDEMGVAVSQVLEARGAAPGDIMIIGLDGTDEAIRTIAAGTNCMTATVYVDTVAIGRGCGNSIVDFLADGTKSDIITEYTLIDGSNAAEYVTEAE